MKKLTVAFFILVAAMAIVSVFGAVKLINSEKADSEPREEASDKILENAATETEESETDSIVQRLVFKTEDESDKIPDGYIAILRGGTGEITYNTYVYQTEDGFEYINTTRTTLSWGSTKGKVKIDSQGSSVDMDRLLKIAEDHGSAQFVTFPDENKARPIDDFKAEYG